MTPADQNQIQMRRESAKEDAKKKDLNSSRLPLRFCAFAAHSFGAFANEASVYRFDHFTD
jgi:hypothetical protein